MKAILFAAGLGTRLGAMTQNTPKALVKINGKPLLFHAIEKLKSSGVNQLVVNVHHFADQIISYLCKNDFGITVHISDEREQLLDTGGGMLKARPYLDGDKPFIAYNVDVLTSLNLKEVIEYHHEYNPLATLVVRQRSTSRYFLFDQKMQLAGWRNKTTGEEIFSKSEQFELAEWAFSGIQIVSPEIFDLIGEQGKFSVTPLYLRMAQEHRIVGFPDHSDFWIDLGKPGQIEQAEQQLRYHVNLEK